MKLSVVIVAASLAVLLATPGAVASGMEDDARIDCTSTPTNIPAIDNTWQNTCRFARGFCDLFDPCPIQQ